jgi:hypothetical protein
MAKTIDILFLFRINYVFKTITIGNDHKGSGSRKKYEVLLTITERLLEMESSLVSNYDFFIGATTTRVRV